MTDAEFNARIERLVERHEALAQSVELMGHQMEGMRLQIADLIVVTNQDAENIRALARIAESHERRIERLEGPA